MMLPGGPVLLMLRNDELKAYSLRWPGAAFPICRSAGLSLRSNGPPELAKKTAFLNECTDA